VLSHAGGTAMVLVELAVLVMLVVMLGL